MRIKSTQRDLGTSSLIDEGSFVCLQMSKTFVVLSLETLYYFIFSH